MARTDDTVARELPWYPGCHPSSASALYVLYIPIYIFKTQSSKFLQDTNECMHIHQVRGTSRTKGHRSQGRNTSNTCGMHIANPLHTRLNTFLSSLVTVVILLTVKCSHLDLFVLCIGLRVGTLALHKKTHEIRAIIVNLQASKSPTRSLDEPNNRLAGWYWMTRTSFSAKVALNNLNDGAHATVCSLADSAADHLNLEVAQMIFNSTMALALAIHIIPGFKGTFAGTVGRRDKNVGDRLIEDPHLRR